MATNPVQWGVSAGIVLAGLALGFGLGRWSAPTRSPEGSVSGNSASESRKERSVNRLTNWDRPAPEASEDRSYRERISDPAPIAYVPGMADEHSAFVRNPTKVLRTALQGNDQNDRYLAFAEVLRGLDETNIHTALAAFENLPPGTRRSEEFYLLIRAWASFDGPSSMAYINEKFSEDGRGHQQAAHSALSGWATHDPDGALAWAKDNFEGLDNPFFLGVIDGVANNDLTAASKIMEVLPYGRLRGKAVDSMINEYLRKDIKYAQRWAERLDDDLLRQGTVARLAGRMAYGEPEEAAAWLDTMPSEGLHQAAASVAMNWTRKDPAAAAEWTASLKDDVSRNQAMAGVVSSWSRRDAPAAAEWLSQFDPSPELDASVSSLVQRLRYQDPETALSWAVSITDEASRTKQVQEVMKFWTKRDPEGAAAFLQSQ